MSKYANLSYETSGFTQTFVHFSTLLLRDIKEFCYKHIYLLGYF